MEYQANKRLEGEVQGLRGQVRQQARDIDWLKLEAEKVTDQEMKRLALHNHYRANEVTLRERIEQLELKKAPSP